MEELAMFYFCHAAFQKSYTNRHVRQILPYRYG